MCDMLLFIRHTMRLNTVHSFQHYIARSYLFRLIIFNEWIKYIPTVVICLKIIYL